MKHTVCNPQDLAQLVYYLGNMRQPFTCRTELGVEEGRRAKQNRLAFQWYGDIARQLDGWDVDAARATSKLECGVQLMVIEDEEFRAKWYAMIKDRFTYEEKLAFMLEPFDFPVTRLMTVKRMSRYLERMERYWSPQGVTLTDPEMLKYEGEK